MPVAKVIVVRLIKSLLLMVIKMKCYVKYEILKFLPTLLATNVQDFPRAEEIEFSAADNLELNLQIKIDDFYFTEFLT